MVPKHSDEVVDHEANFSTLSGRGKSPVQNEIFGNNTSIACHMANYSYFKQTAAIWDAGSRKIKS